MEAINDKLSGPIHRHLTETRKGNSIIRAFDKADTFDAQMHEILDERVVFYVMERSVWCTFVIYMQSMNVSVAASAFALCLYYVGSVDPVKLVLALQYSRGSCSHIMWLYQHLSWTFEKMQNVQNVFDLFKIAQEKETGSVQVDA